jgi:hypothetical protein
MTITSLISEGMPSDGVDWVALHSLTEEICVSLSKQIVQIYEITKRDNSQLRLLLREFQSNIERFVLDPRTFSQGVKEVFVSIDVSEDEEKWFGVIKECLRDACRIVYSNPDLCYDGHGNKNTFGKTTAGYKNRKHQPFYEVDVKLASAFIDLVKKRILVGRVRAVTINATPELTRHQIDIGDVIPYKGEINEYAHDTDDTDRNSVNGGKEGDEVIDHGEQSIKDLGDNYTNDNYDKHESVNRTYDSDSDNGEELDEPEEPEEPEVNEENEINTEYQQHEQQEEEQNQEREKDDESDGDADEEEEEEDKKHGREDEECREDDSNNLDDVDVVNGDSYAFPPSSNMMKDTGVQQKSREEEIKRVYVRDPVKSSSKTSGGGKRPSVARAKRDEVCVSNAGAESESDFDVLKYLRNQQQQQKQNRGGEDDYFNDAALDIVNGEEGSPRSFEIWELENEEKRKKMMKQQTTQNRGERKSDLAVVKKKRSIGGTHSHSREKRNIDTFF